MTNVLFMDTPYVYKYTIVEANVDADLVQKFIIKAQNLNIQNAIGQNLYQTLIDNFNNNGTFTQPYLTLVKDYIQPCQAEWIVYHLLPFMNYRLTNKAVSQKSSDNSQPSTVDDVRWLRDQVRNTAEFYTERLKDYIRNNPSLFPEYYTVSLTFEVRPNKTGYFSGIWTRGANYQGPMPPAANIDPCDFCD